MQIKLPPDPGWMGDRKRGASLGRGGVGDASNKPLRFTLRRVPINRGGYDSGGAYWGVGQPLYWAACGPSAYVGCTSEIDRFFRAADRAAAKATIRNEFPNATFYN